jgi:lysyl-tRNA synthetase class 1
MNDIQRKAIRELLDAIKDFSRKGEDSETPNELQSRIFDIARNNGLEPKEFFRLLYRMLINADRGPRIANYIIDLGLERTSKIIREYT